MKRWLLLPVTILCLWATVAHADPDSNTYWPLTDVDPASGSFGGANYPSQLFNSLTSENAARSLEYGFTNFVYTGQNTNACLGTTGAGLTMTPGACIGYNAGFRAAVDPSGSTGFIKSITFANNKSTWVAMDENTSGNNALIPNFTRVAGSHYLIDAIDTTQPAMATDSQLLMLVTTSGGAITAVQDLRNTSSGIPNHNSGYLFAADFGMVADAQTNTTATMTIGDNTLVVAGSVFKPTDCHSGTGCTGPEDKTITVGGRGTNGVTLFTTITEYDSGTQVKLAANSDGVGVPTSVVSEAHILTSDPLPQDVILVHQQVSAVVVKNSTGTITYATPLDYTVDASGGALNIPASSTISPGDTIKVSYTYNSSTIWWGTDQSFIWDTFRLAAQLGVYYARVGILPPGNIMLATPIVWTGTDLYGPASILILAADTSTGVCNANNEQGAKFSDEQSGDTRLTIAQIIDVNNDGQGGCTLRVGGLSGANSQNIIAVGNLFTSGEPSTTRTTGLHNPIGLVTLSATSRWLWIGRVGSGVATTPGGFSKPVVIAGGQDLDYSFGVIGRPDYSMDNAIYDDSNPVITCAGNCGAHTKIHASFDGALMGFSMTGSGAQIVDIYGSFSGDAHTGADLFAAGNTYTTAGFVIPSVETTVAAGPCVGTSCPVTSSTGFVAGSRITIDVGANQESATVLSVSGNTLTLVSALSASHANTTSVRRPNYAGHWFRVAGATGATCVAGAQPSPWVVTALADNASGACHFLEYGSGFTLNNSSGDTSSVLNVNGGDYQFSLGAVLAASANPTNVNNIRAANVPLAGVDCESCSALNIQGSNISGGYSDVWLNSATRVFMRTNRFNLGSATGRCNIAVNGLTSEDIDGSATTCLYTGSTPMPHLTVGVKALAATVTGTPTADFSTYGWIKHTLTSATNPTYIFTPPNVAIGYDACATLQVCQSGGTPSVVTWPTNCNSSNVAGCVRWGGAGAAPALTAVAGEGDTFRFCYNQLDLKWDGFQIRAAGKPCP